MQATLPQAHQRFLAPGARTSALLLLVMLMAMVASLVSAEWTDGMALLTPVVLGGFAVGVALSASRWSGLFPLVHSAITGAAWVLYWISRAPQVPVELTGAARVGFVVQSFLEWLSMLVGDAPMRSNLVFLLELATLLWWLAYLAAWAVFREGRVWRAIIPTGLIMAVNMYFAAGGQEFYFAVFVVCSLLLAVRTYLAEQELTWRRMRIRYAEDIHFDFLRDGFIFALLVVLLASFLPRATDPEALQGNLGALRRPWERVQEEWVRMFSALNYQGAGVSAAFSNSLTLGGPRNLGNRVIMDVKSPAGRYWRAAVYDTYTGRRWLNTSTATQAIDFGTHVNTPTFEARREVTQTVTLYAPSGGVLYALPQPLRVSLGATADLTIIEPATDERGPLAEITMLHRRGQELREGQSYLAVSSISTATVEDLQEAGTDYPEWVVERYLDVPPSVPERVRALAQEITAGLPTPFDKAAALERYLRTIPYNDQIEAPPPGVDAVDYFLFDAKAGYCDYYASALAIMARSLGIPARVAAGYAQGTYSAEVDAYRVLESDGHSWVEIFFPGYGWIEFEPTASQDAIDRPTRPEDQVGPEQEQGPRSGFPEPLDRPELDLEELLGEEPAPDDSTAVAELASRNPAAVALVGVVAVAVLALALWRRRRRSPRVPGSLQPQLVLTIYGRLMEWAQRLRLPLQPSQTPHERAAVLAQAVPQGQPAIATITEVYVREQYSPYPVEAESVQEVVVAWEGLRPLLRRAWLSLRTRPRR
ncbi:MAG: DUF3488 and transglutaminase-like domain-containing protein [Caldilineales bacterium]|nr:DUF3488 and transglutaminase-like domain-containing protein [Caldilineales bacterium]